MNDARRSRLKEAVRLLQRAENSIESVCDEEKDSLSNIPENLQNSDRYMAMEDAVDLLEGAISNIQEAADGVNQALA